MPIYKAFDEFDFIFIASVVIVHLNIENKNTAIMNKEIIIQNLTESFNVLKDSWDYKKDAIINCIVETEQYDGALSMDMWLYILRQHKPIETQEDAKSLVDDVLERFLTKNEEHDYSSGENKCRAFLNHVVPHLINNDELIRTIFRYTYNVSYYYDPEWDNLLNRNIAVCIGCIILLGNKHIIDVLIESLSQNGLMHDISFGWLLLKANKCIEYICRNEYEFGKKYVVSDEVKHALLESLEFIKDKNERAECTIAFLSY